MTGQQPRQIDVVGAVIVRDGRILCALRERGPLAGTWEFPGGKIEPGETAAEALVREVDEEIDCRVRVGELVATTRYVYDFAVVKLTTFYCELVEGEPVCTEHAALQWLTATEFADLDWAPADLPAVARLVDDLG